jgi:hypothetical protein
MRTCLVLAMVMAVGCGGGKKVAEEPDDTGEVGEGPDDGPDDQYCSEQTYDELNTTFKGKARTVNRCYVDALEDGKLQKGSRGSIIVNVTIGPGGEVKDVDITADSLKSDAVNSCVVTLVKGWTLPGCGSDNTYSYAYKFEP